MNEAKRRLMLSGVKLVDSFLMIISFGLSTILTVNWDQRVGLEQFFSIRVKLSNCVIFGGILLTWHLIVFLCGVYESKRLSARRVEIINVFKATTISSGFLA